MQQRRLITVLFGVFTLALSGIWYFSCQEEGPKHYQSFNDEKVKKEAKAQGAGYRGAAEYLHMLQKNPYTNKVSMADIKRSVDQANSNARAKKSSHIQWESMGPDNVGGRTRAIVVDNENPRVLYAGGVSGGLWKSTNRGQSWSRVPYEGADQYKALTIVSMVQTSDGTLYFGTGEQGFTGSGLNNLTSGNIGMGIWKSEDRGETWEHLEATKPSSPMTGSNNRWNNVHELAVDPNDPDRILAATDRDIQISEDGGQTWQSAGATNLPVLEVNFSPDGQTVLVGDASGGLHISRDGGANFQNVTDDVGISDEGGRIESAIAPSDPNFMYLSVAKGDRSGGRNGKLEGIYKSEDNGENWEKILGDGSIVDPFSRTRSGSGQGFYDNVIAVDPHNKERIFVGGIEFWLYDGDWKKAASDFGANTNDFYLHVDHHEIVFDTVSDPTIMYNGNDGGIFMSKNFKGNRNPTYQDRNIGYVTTQFYALDVHPNGNIIGGTQDNGIQKRLKSGISGESYKRINEGDGFYTAISHLNPNIFFFESQFGNLRRSPDQGSSSSDAWQVFEFFDCNSDVVSCNDDDEITGLNGGQFNTPFELWESSYDTLSNDSVFFTGDTLAHYPQGTVISPDTIRDGYEQFFQEDTANFNQTNNGNYETKRDLAHVPGEVIRVFSNNAVEFKDTLKKGLVPEEDHLIQDVVRSFFAMAVGPDQQGERDGEVLFTKEILQLSQSPEWFRFKNLNLVRPEAIEFSKDGNHLFVGGSPSNGGGIVIRISGLKTARFESGNFNPDSAGIEIEEIGSFNTIVTGLDLAEGDQDRLLVTSGNYGNFDHVRYSENALDSAHNVTFNALDTEGPSNVNLPQMPVYDGIFLEGSPDTVIVGTEMGIWIHDMGNPSQGWVENNQGMDRVPTHMLKQVKWKPWHENSKVFAATHGRGIFRTGSFHTSTEDDVTEKVNKDDSGDEEHVTLFPNPATTKANIRFDLENQSNVRVQVYSVSGELVEQKSYENLSSGKQKLNLNTSQYKAGQYIVQVDGGNFAESSKLLVQ